MAPVKWTEIATLQQELGLDNGRARIRTFLEPLVATVGKACSI